MSKADQFANEITSLTAVQTTAQANTNQLMNQLNENSSLSQKVSFEKTDPNNPDGPSKTKYMY